MGQPLKDGDTMNRNALRYLALAFVPLLFAACDQVNAPAPQDPSAGLSAEAQRTNRALDEMAQLFAQAVSDESLRQQLHAEVAKRFDGDTNTLYKTLSASSNVRSQLAGVYSRGVGVQAGDALSAIDTLARDIPRFQVAVPAQFEAWDAATYTPLVGFMPTGVEDTTLESITAYDAAGRAHTLGAQVAPDKPVIILGLSERTDASGRLLEAYAGGQEPAANTLYPSACRKVEVEGIDLYDDKEPWAKGDAEVKLIAKSYSGSSLYYHGDFLGANHDDGGYYDYNRVIGCTGKNVIFYWYEDDSGSLDFTVSYRGVSLSTRIADGDDFMGANIVRNKYFGGNINKHYLGSIRFDNR
jgi:hypothetical protein